MITTRLLSALACCLLFAAAPAAAQCLLANPSFELSGSGGAEFGGWNQFGDVGSAASAHHGSAAARVRGPDAGGWDVSAFWQARSCDPGESWDVTGHVRVPSSAPLTGSCTAIVNVEWRDGADQLLDYESVTVADAASLTDAWIDFEFTSGAAPSGTATARLLLGVLQSPDASVPDVHYDQVTFDSTTSPTIDEIQWSDFPGQEVHQFADRTWRVKGPGVYGPGDNYFCDLLDCNWVDAEGRLHITVKDRGYWASSEVVLDEALGYGDYVLTTVGRLDLLDPEVVLGIFLWEYGPCWDYGYLWWNPYNEIDIEYSRWQDPASDLAQFVAQPYDYPGNISRFDAVFAEDERVSHAMRWSADRVEYRVWRGGPLDESAATMIHSWTYTGPHLPRPEQPRLHLNLWKLDGTPASDQEVVFEDFLFVPEGVSTGVEDDASQGSTPPATGRLLPPAPNPFNPLTTISFELPAGGRATIEVFDVSGRLVRSLVDGRFTTARHDVTWDGRDDAGRRLASGAYTVQLRGEGFMESRGVVLVK